MSNDTVTVINDTTRIIELPRRKTQRLGQAVRCYPGANLVDREHLEAISSRDSEDYKPYVDELFDPKAGMLRLADVRDRPWTADVTLSDLPEELAKVEDMQELKRLWLADVRKGARAQIEERMSQIEKDEANQEVTVGA